MNELNLKGMPSVVQGEKLELPFPLIELLRTPQGIRISADDMYKHGGEIGRWLLDRTPIKNNRKHVVTYLTLNYLEPNISHVPTTDWHCDGSNVPFLADDIFHTMICMGEGLSGEIKTEFLKEEKKILIPDSIDVNSFTHASFRRWITDREQEYNFTSVECDVGKMCTWTTLHLHRVGLAKTPQFRMFWKVAESDSLLPKPTNEAFSSTLTVQTGQDHRMLNTSSINIEQGQRGIIIRGMRIGE
jgi:hypothetical protein